MLSQVWAALERMGPEGLLALVRRLEDEDPLVRECSVIALGGMDAHRAAVLNWPRWAAIDGLS